MSSTFGANSAALQSMACSISTALLHCKASNGWSGGQNGGPYPGQLHRVPLFVPMQPALSHIADVDRILQIKGVHVPTIDSPVPRCACLALARELLTGMEMLSPSFTAPLALVSCAVAMPATRLLRRPGTLKAVWLPSLHCQLKLTSEHCILS